MTYTNKLERIEPQAIKVETSPFYEEEEANKMRAKLTALGVLRPAEVEIVVNHICFGYTMDIIAKIMGYMDRRTTHRAYQTALAKLKKAGYQ